MAERRRPAPSPKASPYKPAPSSPVTGARSRGVDVYSTDYVRKMSSGVDTSTKDSETTLTNCIVNADVKIGIVASGGLVWLALRDGSILVVHPSGQHIHVIDKKRGVFVWCMCEVLNTMWIGCSDGFIRVIQQTSYTVEEQLGKHRGGGAGVHALTFHQASSTVYSGGNDFQIIAWNAATRQVTFQLNNHVSIRALYINCSHHAICCGNEDGTVTCYDMISKAKTKTLQGHTKSVLCITKANSFLWTGGEDTKICIWNFETGECIGWSIVHTGPVITLAVAGNRVFSGAGDTLCVWDASKLELLGTYVEHRGYITSVLTIRKVENWQIWSTGTDGQVNSWLCNQSVLPDAAPREDVNNNLDFKNRTLMQSNESLVQLTEIMKSQLHSKEQSASEMAAQIERLQEELASLRDAKQEARTLHEKLHESNTARATQDEEMNVLRNENFSLLSSVKDLETKLCAMMTNPNQAIEMFDKKITKSELINKYRLGLLSDVYKLYKKMEMFERKHKLPPEPKADYIPLMRSIKECVTVHFTDSELNHLGTSRHYFPYS